MNRNQKQLLTDEDVAEYLHISVALVRRWRVERRGPRFIKVASLVRYRPEDIELFLTGCRTGGGTSEG